MNIEGTTESKKQGGEGNGSGVKAGREWTQTHKDGGMEGEGGKDIREGGRRRGKGGYLLFQKPLHLLHREASDIIASREEGRASQAVVRVYTKDSRW
jgi:hypothetical protein